MEVVYTYFKQKVWINRGFLKGPICPIYGIGVIAITWAVGPVMNLAIVFVLVVILTTFLELMTGIILEKLFMTKWWDYSNRRFNYKGYICVRFSLAWGLVGTLLVMFIHPITIKYTSAFLESQIQLVYISLMLLITLLIVDIAFTVRDLIDFRKLLIEIENLLNEYRNVKDKLLNDLEHVVNELEKVQSGVHSSRVRLSGEFGKISTEYTQLKLRIKEQIEAIQKSGIHPNGAMKAFLIKKLDIDTHLELPIKTNISDILERFNNLSTRLSRHRLFESYPELRSKRFQLQINFIREKYLSVRYKKKK